MNDPHDEWDRVPPTYHPPEIYQPPNEEDKEVTRRLIMLAVSIGMGLLIWIGIIWYAVSVIANT